MKNFLICFAFVSSCGPLKLDTAHAATNWRDVYTPEVNSILSEYYDADWTCETDTECYEQASEITDSVTMGLVYIGTGCQVINDFIDQVSDDADRSYTGYHPEYRMLCGPNGESIGWDLSVQ